VGHAFKPDQSLDVEVTIPGPSRLKATPKKPVKDGTASKWTLTVPEGEGNVEARYRPFAPSLTAPSVKSTSEGWVNYAVLPPIGAETYHAVVAAGGSEKRFAFHARRTLPLAVYGVDAATAGAWASVADAVAKAFEPAGIAFTQAAGSPTQTDRADFFLEGGDHDALVREGVARLFSSGRLPSVDPGALRLLFVRQLVRHKDMSWTSSKALTQAEVVENNYVRPPGAGRLVTGSPRFQVKLIKAKDNATVMDVTDDSTLDKDGVEINLGFKRYMLGEDTWWVRLRYEAALPGFYGWSNENVIVAATQGADGSALDPGVIARIVIHELGHSLGQVLGQRETFGAAKGPEANDLQYTKHGGVGNHCRTGAKETTDASVDADGHLTYGWAGGDDMCVMHHDVTKPHVGTTFCPSCVLNLRLTDLRLGAPRRARWA
jgi:hypothetical protein